MTADVSQDRRVTVLNRGHKPPALTEGSRLDWALPSPVHERSGYRASRPTGYKVMRSFRIVVHGPILASRPACHRDTARCGRAMMAPSSARSRPLTRRLRRWPSASLDRASPWRQRPPPTNDAPLDNLLPIQGSAEITRPSLRDGLHAYMQASWRSACWPPCATTRFTRCAVIPASRYQNPATSRPQEHRSSAHRKGHAASSRGHRSPPRVS